MPGAGEGPCRQSAPLPVGRRLSANRAALPLLSCPWAGERTPETIRPARLCTSTQQFTHAKGAGSSGVGPALVGSGTWGATLWCRGCQSGLQSHARTHDMARQKNCVPPRPRSGARARGRRRWAGGGRRWQSPGARESARARGRLRQRRACRPSPSRPKTPRMAARACEVGGPAPPAGVPAGALGPENATGARRPRMARPAGPPGCEAGPARITKMSKTLGCAGTPARVGGRARAARGSTVGRRGVAEQKQCVSARHGAPPAWHGRRIKIVGGRPCHLKMRAMRAWGGAAAAMRPNQPLRLLFLNPLFFVIPSPYREPSAPTMRSAPDHPRHETRYQIGASRAGSRRLLTWCQTPWPSSPASSRGPRPGRCWQEPC
jgi:hypothetical protein